MANKMTHEEYISKLAKVNPNIEVIGTYIKSGIKIAHKCKLDDYEWDVTPNNILRGHGCPVCSGRTIGKAPEYKNSIFSSEYKEYFSKYLTEEQMKLYTPHSSKVIKIKCPDCGKYKNISIDVLSRGSLCCTCGDGQSYPNKFMYSLLNQLDIDYIHEYSPDWAYDKRYDIYIPSLSCIIENHGEQHYKDKTGFELTLKQQQENDFNKEAMAIANGIKYYIVIDCRKSEIKWIKNSIMKSILPDIIHFNEEDIDWKRCSADAIKNVVKEVCEYYKENKISTALLATKFKISQTSVIDYLKKGNKIGWCVFNPLENIREAAKQTGKNTMPVYQYGLDGIFIREWKGGAAEVERELGIVHTSICFCCKGKYETAGGFMWRHIYSEKLAPYENKALEKIVQCTIDSKPIKIWNGVVEAQKSLNIYHIADCCNGNRKQAGGYNWYYLYDHLKRTHKDGITILGAISLRVITEEEVLNMSK